MAKNQQNTGVPTGPLLAQKIVQLPNQKGLTQQEEHKYARGQKVKLDRLHKQDTAIIGGPVQIDNKQRITIIEVEQEGSPQNRNKLKM